MGVSIFPYKCWNWLVVWVSNPRPDRYHHFAYINRFIYIEVNRRRSSVLVPESCRFQESYCTPLTSVQFLWLFPWALSVYTTSDDENERRPSLDMNIVPFCILFIAVSTIIGPSASILMYRPSKVNWTISHHEQLVRIRYLFRNFVTFPNQQDRAARWPSRSILWLHHCLIVERCQQIFFTWHSYFLHR